MGLRRQLGVGIHPDHPPPETLDPKPQLRQDISHQPVLLVAVAATPTPDQLVGERGGPEVGDGYAHQRVEVLERNGPAVGGHQGSVSSVGSAGPVYPIRSK